MAYTLPRLKSVLQDVSGNFVNQVFHAHTTQTGPECPTARLNITKKIKQPVNCFYPSISVKMEIMINPEKSQE